MLVAGKPIVLPLLAWGIAVLALADDSTNPAQESTMKVVRDQVYCRWDDQTSLLCDIFLPGEADLPSPQPRHLPVVIMVPGGGWVMANKWTMEQHARMVCSQGMAAVTINYRLAPQYRFPAQVDDVRMAIDWVRQQKATYPFDADRVGLFGYSAGAHLSSLIGVLSDERPESQRLTSLLPAEHPLLQNPVHPKAIVAGGPPCDFRDEPLDTQLYEYFLGGTRRQLPEVYRNASPISFVSAGDSPIYFYHGTEDVLTSPVRSKQFFEKQRQAGVSSQYQSLPGKGHLLAFLDWDTQQKAIRFLCDALKSDARAGDQVSKGPQP